MVFYNVLYLTTFKEYEIFNSGLKCKVRRKMPGTRLFENIKFSSYSSWQKYNNFNLIYILFQQFTNLKKNLFRSVA